MIYVGIDPGMSGAIAWFTELGDLIAVEDMPLKGEGKQRRVDGQVLASYILEHAGMEDTVIAVERVHSMPQQGVASTFRFGMSYGVALAVADICSTYHHSVRPQEWKKLFNLIGKDKDAARLLVLDYFPDQAGLFARKKDQGRADAALVALWALDQRS